MTTTGATLACMAKMKSAVALGKRRAELVGPEGMAELGMKRMKGLTKKQRRELAASGGLAGGAARAKALTPEQRKEIAKKAAAARWGKKPR